MSFVAIGAIVRSVVVKKSVDSRGQEIKVCHAEVDGGKVTFVPIASFGALLDKAGVAADVAADPASATA